MKITLILGSPRKQGNTASVLQNIGNKLAKHCETENIHITDYEINGCLGCSKCQTIINQPACVQKDDAEQILQQLIKTDVIVYGTPLYGHCYSAQLKTFLDRQVALFKFIKGKDKAVSQMEMKSLIEGKPVVLLVTCQGPERNNTEIIKLLFNKYCETSKSLSLGTFVVPFCTNDILESRQKSKDVAKQIVEQIHNLAQVK